MPWSFPLPPMQPRSRDLPQRWIPVSERLPERTTIGPYVLVKITGYYWPQVATRLASGDWETSDGRVYRPWEIAHWMPLPAPPGAP